MLTESSGTFSPELGSFTLLVAIPSSGETVEEVD